jgi:hypothetical protein
MRRIFVISLLCGLIFSAHAQLIKFNTLVEGVENVAVIKKELILNGFTRLSENIGLEETSDYTTTLYAYNYNAIIDDYDIVVALTNYHDVGDVGFEYHAIIISTSGHELFEYLKGEINEHCEFSDVDEHDRLLYYYEDSTSSSEISRLIDITISSEDGNDLITVSPNRFYLLMRIHMEEMLDSLDLLIPEEQ